jgi:hypothetical protein
MSNEQLLGKHRRLRQELSAAYAKPSWDTAHIARITSDLAVVERALALAGAQPVEVLVQRPPLNAQPESLGEPAERAAS